MEIQLGNLKYLVGRLDDRNNSYGKSLRLRYAKELSRDDNQSMIPLKETMNSKRISKEGHKVCRTAEQKSAAGLDNWQIWIPTPPDTQIPLPIPVTGPNGDVRIAVPQALTRLYNDSENLSLSFRYRHVMQTGLMGDLTMEQFEAATSQLSAFEYVPEQHVNLELQDAVTQNLRAYINQNSAILSEDEKEKHAAIVNMTTCEPRDVQTISMFFQFIVSWFIRHESSLVRAESEFIRGSVEAGCGRTMAEVVQDGELIVPIFEFGHWSCVVISYRQQQIKLYDSTPHRTMPHVVKNICVHFDVPETFASHIVKCPIQHGFYTDGLFMVYNIIAHLRGLADPYQLYNGDVDSLQVFRDWLAAAMLRDDIPKDYQFN